MCKEILILIRIFSGFSVHPFFISTAHFGDRVTGALKKSASGQVAMVLISNFGLLVKWSLFHLCPHTFFLASVPKTANVTGNFSGWCKVMFNYCRVKIDQLTLGQILLVLTSLIVFIFHNILWQQYLVWLDRMTCNVVVYR